MRTAKSQRSKRRFVHFAPLQQKEDKLDCLIVKQITIRDEVLFLSYISRSQIYLNTKIRKKKNNKFYNTSGNPMGVRDEYFYCNMNNNFPFKTLYNNRDILTPGGIPSLEENQRKEGEESFESEINQEGKRKTVYK